MNEGEASRREKKVGKEGEREKKGRGNREGERERKEKRRRGRIGEMKPLFLPAHIIPPTRIYERIR